MKQTHLDYIIQAQVCKAILLPLMSFHVFVIWCIQKIKVCAELYIIQVLGRHLFYCLQVLIFSKIQIQMRMILIYHSDCIILDLEFLGVVPFLIFVLYQMSPFQSHCLSNFLNCICQNSQQYCKILVQDMIIFMFITVILLQILHLKFKSFDVLNCNVQDLESKIYFNQAFLLVSMQL